MCAVCASFRAHILPIILSGAHTHKFPTVFKAAAWLSNRIVQMQEKQHQPFAKCSTRAAFTAKSNHLTTIYLLLSTHTPSYTLQQFPQTDVVVWHPLITICHTSLLCFQHKRIQKRSRIHTIMHTYNISTFTAMCHCSHAIQDHCTLTCTLLQQHPHHSHLTVSPVCALKHYRGFVVNWLVMFPLMHCPSLMMGVIKCDHISTFES